MPSLFPGDDRTNGVGDTVFTAFLSPGQAGRVDLGRRAGGPAPDQHQLSAWQQELGNGSVRSSCFASRKAAAWVYGVLGQQRLVFVPVMNEAGARTATG